MPDVNVRGRYRAFTYDGTTPLDFTTYANNVSVIRRPNEISFVTLRQYIPGISTPFTTFEPGSSYVVVSRDSDTNFNMGPYTRVDRLPSSLNVKSPQYYLGLDKNSITIPLSVYALSVNNPLSSVTGITYVNGSGISQSTVTVDQIRNGFQTSFTHFMPNSGYQLRNRVPFTFFAPLQSEMGDAFALGNNSGGEYGMGYRYSQTMAFWDRGGLPFVLSADQTFGIWDKIVFNNNIQQVTWNGQTFLASSLAALSSCGTSKALFVLGSNLYGQLGTGSSQQYYPTWTKIAGQWKDIEMGAAHLVALNNLSNLYACGSNTQGQLGLGPGVVSTNTLTLVEDQIQWVQIATLDYSTFLRNSEGQVLGCGNNTSGQLGIGNTISPIFDFTEETTYSQWTSIKTSKTFDNLIALKNNALYGCGLRNRIYGGGSTGSQTILTREILNLADITDFYTTGIGTFIKRQGQDYLFAAGESGSTNKLATLTGTSNQPYFTKTTIPSNVKNIFSNYSIVVNAGEFYNLGYIGSNSNVYSKAYNNNTFTQKQFNAFDAFSSTGAAFSQMQSPIFLLSAASHFRPTPTPTITLTPTVTPTPTKTPVPLPPPSFGYIVVAGGGGGGWAQFGADGDGSNRQGGSGGGAGGVKYSGAFNARTGVTYQISVGAGGAGGISSDSRVWAQKGASSSISNSIDGVIVTCEGGGWGGGVLAFFADSAAQGGPGGSGGGGNFNSANQPVNSGIAGQGNNGGNGYAKSHPVYGTGVHNGGAGGGSSQAGSPGSPNGAGNGGSGTQYIIGSKVIQVGGGGGGGRGSYLLAGTGGFGGGASGSTGGVGGAGTDGTGGGGGGASAPNANRTSGRLTGGKGGDGVVYIFYPTSYAAATTTNAAQPEISGNYRIYRFFTGNGTIRFN